MDGDGTRTNKSESGFKAHSRKAFSGTGLEVNSIPASTGLAFGKRALCPQGPEGLSPFCWNRLQTVAKFWEKNRGRANNMKMARMMRILR